MDVDDGDVEMDWLSVKEEACSPGTQTEKSLAMCDVGTQTEKSLATCDVGTQTGNYSAPVSTMTQTDMVKTKCNSVQDINNHILPMVQFVDSLKYNDKKCTFYTGLQMIVLYSYY